MGRSSVAAREGVPLVAYPRAPGAAPVSVSWWTPGTAPTTTTGPHAHDFLVLLSVERGSGPLRVDGHDWQLGPGDVLVMAPGAVMGAPRDDLDPELAAWTVFFPADAVDPAGAAPLVSWRAHPLLAPFVDPSRAGARRLTVPPEQRPAWSERLAALAAELAGRRDHHVDAARAHLTLLLVGLGRLGLDDAGALADDPLLAAVFDVVERRYAEAVSAREVAAELGLTPGHLTTVVSRRTGRPLGRWLTERRLREARRLLADTDLTVAAVGRRVGYDDPGYFARRFRREHGVAPQAWRDAGSR